MIRWRTQAMHHLIQGKGRFAIFADYHLRVGEVTADSHPRRRIPVREQRFDATEVGASKLCTIVALQPQDGAALPAGEDAMLDAIRLDRGAPGLNEVAIYDSIYTPGKVLILVSWAGPDAAGGFRPGAVRGAGPPRCRAVRIIRDYGMFDRRETPQYYPEVRRK